MTTTQEKQADSRSSANDGSTSPTPPYMRHQLPDDAPSIVRHIILSYLVHNCHEETAKSFASSITYGHSSPAPHASALDVIMPLFSNNPVKPAVERRTLARDADDMQQDNDDGDLDMDGVPHSQKVTCSMQDHGLIALVKSMDERKRLRECLVQGNTGEAIQMTLKMFPGVMADVEAMDFISSNASTKRSKIVTSDNSSVESSDSVSASTDSLAETKKHTLMTLSPEGTYDPLSISFQLHCLHFIEMVRRGMQVEALQYAQSTLSKFSHARPSYTQTLTDVVALIAYKDPMLSPIASLLDVNQRIAVADALNCAILMKQKVAPHSALEMLVKQVTCVREALVKDSHGKSKKQLAKSMNKWSMSDLYGELDG